MQKRKLRLSDLGKLSKENAERRQESLRALSMLPLAHTAEDIRRVTEVYPPLLDEIIMAGAKVLAAAVGRPRANPICVLADAKRARSAQGEYIREMAREIVGRAEIGARVVELLDSIQINGKMLGDCTRSEVLAEADRDARRSEALAERANWLRSLANILGQDQTVRMADRSAVLEILQEAP